MSLADELLADLEDVGMDGEEMSMENEHDMNADDDGIDDIDDIDNINSQQKSTDTSRITHVAR